jgi:hypothetical protein
MLRSLSKADLSFGVSGPGQIRARRTHAFTREVAGAMRLQIRLPLERVASEVYALDECPRVPASYILCSEDRTINQEWPRRAARERLSVEAIEIPGGHCPYLPRPALLAQVLAGLADA